MKMVRLNRLRGILRAGGRGLVLLALAPLAGLMLLSTRASADSVYVWSNDGTLQQISTTGVTSLVTNNLSGWNGPVGLACDNVGNVYAGVPGESRIWRFSPDGNCSLVGLSVDSVSGLAFDSNGNLYATIPNYVEVTKLDFSSGHYWLSQTDYTQSNLSYPVNLAFDSTGILYVANNTNANPLPLIPHPSPYDNTIQKFAPDLTALGTFATGLNCPSGMAFDSGGNLFVANAGTNRNLANTIVKFTTNGVRSIFATATSGLSSPHGLAFDSAGNLYVANSLGGTIIKFLPNGTGSVFASGLNSPSSIAIFPGLRVWSATPIKLGNATMLPGGVFQFGFTDNAGLIFTVSASTNASVSLPNWTTLGLVTEVESGHYQFTDQEATNHRQRFYIIRSP